MKIRDLHASVNGDDTVIVLPSGGLEILSDNGKALFTMHIEKNVLHISSGSFCKHEGEILEDSFVLRPVASNRIDLIKVKHISV